MNNHTDDNISSRIDAYIKGKLSEEEIEQLWIEIAKDPVLLDQLKTEVNLKKIIEENDLLNKSASGGGLIAQLPRFTWHIAAVFILIVITALQLLSLDSSGKLEEFLVPEISAAQLETSGGVRLNDIAFTTADSLLNLGFKAVISNNHTKGLRLYDNVIQLQTNDLALSKAYFNTGVIHFNKGNYEEAKSSFKKTLTYLEDYPMLEEKALWFLGNTCAKLGELKEAREAVLKTYRMDGLFNKEAFKLLKRLDFELGNLSSEIPAEIKK